MFKSYIYFILAKIRLRVKALGIQNITELLSVDDLVVGINAAECLTNLAEDADIRVEIIKNGAIPLLMSAAMKPDLKIQTNAALAMARCLNDGIYF